MALKIPNFKSNNVACPIYIPSAATLAFAALTGRLAWLEGDAGNLIANSNWYDRMTGAAFPVTGTLAGGGDTRTSGSGVLRGAASFTGTQSVNLGSIFPTAGDWSVFAVYKQTSAANGTILGSAGASWHSLFATTAGNINNFDATALTMAGSTAHAINNVYRVGFMRGATSPRSYKLQVGGTDEQSGTGGAANTDPTAIVGSNPGAGGSPLPFVGSLFHLSFWNKIPSAGELATINAYLAEQYG